MVNAWRPRRGGSGSIEELESTPIAGDLSTNETAFQNSANTLFRGQSDGSIIVYTQSSIITDTQDPVASLFGSLPNLVVNSPGEIQIDYVDNVGINLSTIDNSSLTVVDGATNAAVVFQSSSPINSGKGYRALFQVTASEEGTYAVNVVAGFEDLAGNTGDAVNIGNITVSLAPPEPDTTPPTVALSSSLPSSITQNIQFQITLDIDDNEALNLSSITNDSLIVSTGSIDATVEISSNTGNNPFTNSSI